MCHLKDNAYSQDISFIKLRLCNKTIEQEKYVDNNRRKDVMRAIKKKINNE